MPCHRPVIQLFMRKIICLAVQQQQSVKSTNSCVCLATVTATVPFARAPTKNRNCIFVFTATRDLHAAPPYTPCPSDNNNEDDDNAGDSVLSFYRKMTMKDCKANKATRNEKLIIDFFLCAPNNKDIHYQDNGMCVCHGLSLCLMVCHLGFASDDTIPLSLNCR